MEILYCLLLPVLGFFLVFKPELMWKLEHFLTVKDGEPSDFYLALSRLSGVAAILIGFFMFLYAAANRLS